jgi:hypothetical protein
MDTKSRRKAGHYEILGETHAKLEFFQHHWNPYSRFLDVDKVDLVLRKTTSRGPIYRDVQVKFGKLYRCEPKWERALFDLTSWRFFNQQEFDAVGRHLFLAYVLSEDDHYDGDFFVFPIADFARAIANAPLSAGKHQVYISRSCSDPARWYLRQQKKFTAITPESCLDLSRYRRAFDLLDRDV